MFPPKAPGPSPVRLKVDDDVSMVLVFMVSSYGSEMPLLSMSELDSVMMFVLLRI